MTFSPLPGIRLPSAFLLRPSVFPDYQGRESHELQFRLLEVARGVLDRAGEPIVLLICAVEYHHHALLIPRLVHAAIGRVSIRIDSEHGERPKHLTIGRSPSAVDARDRDPLAERSPDTPPFSLARFVVRFIERLDRDDAAPTLRPGFAKARELVHGLRARVVGALPIGNLFREPRQQTEGSALDDLVTRPAFVEPDECT